jgi:hypothetical protein
MGGEKVNSYYLLAKLYTEPGFEQLDRFEAMKQIVLTKELSVSNFKRFMIDIKPSAGFQYTRFAVDVFLKYS